MTRWGRRVTGLVAAACLVLAAASCSGDGVASTTEPATTAATAPAATATVPMPAAQQAIDLQARAIARATSGLPVSAGTTALW